MNVVMGSDLTVALSHVLQGLCERDERGAMSLSHLAHVAGP